MKRIEEVVTEKVGIDTKKYHLVEKNGYGEQESADIKILMLYETLPGIQSLYDGKTKKWYIVQRAKM